MNALQIAVTAIVNGMEIAVTDEVGGAAILADVTAVTVTCPRFLKESLAEVAGRLAGFTPVTGVTVTEIAEAEYLVTGIPAGFAWHWSVLVFRALVGRQAPRAGGFNPTGAVAHKFVTQFGPSCGMPSDVCRAGNRGAWQLAGGEAFTVIVEPIMVRAGMCDPVYVPRAPGQGRPRKS